MVTRHPYRSVGVVLAVMLVSAFISGMIGQFNDGPWGHLPPWLGAATWFTFLGSVLTIVVLSTTSAWRTCATGTTAAPLVSDPTVH